MSEHRMNRDEGYTLTARLIHWLVAIVVVGMFILGLWMVDLGYYDPWRKDAPEIHKAVGILLFGLMLFRVFWRAVKGAPAPEDSHSSLEHIGAHIAHLALYGLLFSIMISGYLISTADGRDISVFGLFHVPGFGAFFDNQEDLAGDIHYVLAIIVIALAGIHAVAALKHHFIDKDRTLMKMIVGGTTNSED